MLALGTPSAVTVAMEAKLRFESLIEMVPVLELITMQPSLS